MRSDSSTPGVGPNAGRSARAGQVASGAENPVEYAHLDIVAEVERISGVSLTRHTRTSGKYHGACPFPDCTSTHDAFTVWDRPLLEERSDGRREVHFWCGRCGRTGSLISLIRQYREAVTGEQVSWAEAARELRIDPRTRRAMAESAGSPQQTALAGEKRRQRAAQQRQAEQAEQALLEALYHRARQWLAGGQIGMKDGRQIVLDQARAYVQARGYTLEQASQVGMAYVPTIQEVPELAALVPRSWRGRMLFPLTGPQGVHGYAGRTLWRWTPGMTAEQHKHLLDRWNERHPDKRMARHYKTHQPAYYGYDEACHAPILVIVEGEFDAASVRLALADHSAIAVCAFGTHVQARLVPVNVLHVILALDMDQAGQEGTKRLVDALQARGMTVSVAVPPAGNDWNECHVVTGLEAIRTALLQAYPPFQAALRVPAPATFSEQDCGSRPSEPPNDDHGDVCLVCRKQIEDRMDTFAVCEDKRSPFYGDLFCLPCWTALHRRAPSSMHTDLAPDNRAEHGQSSVALFAPTHHSAQDASLLIEVPQVEVDEPATRTDTQEEPFTEANSRCPRHHQAWRYSDAFGRRYCDQVECWERYRLMHYGAACGYPALAGAIEPCGYLPDISQPPLYGTGSGLLVYPVRPPVFQHIISAGVDAWRDYAAERCYYDIDKAIKALLRKQAKHEESEMEETIVHLDASFKISLSCIQEK